MSEEQEFLEKAEQAVKEAREAGEIKEPTNEVEGNFYIDEGYGTLEYSFHSWEADEENPRYDNGMDQAIGGVSIVVHRGK